MGWGRAEKELGKGPFGHFVPRMLPGFSNANKEGLRQPGKKLQARKSIYIHVLWVVCMGQKGWEGSFKCGYCPEMRKHAESSLAVQWFCFGKSSDM